MFIWKMSQETLVSKWGGEAGKGRQSAQGMISSNCHQRYLEPCRYESLQESPLRSREGGVLGPYACQPLVESHFTHTHTHTHTHGQLLINSLALLVRDAGLLADRWGHQTIGDETAVTCTWKAWRVVGEPPSFNECYNWKEQNREEPPAITPPSPDLWRGVKCSCPSVAMGDLF
jgi:hypothetical protein